jgi:hypothetical protein
MRLLTKEFYTLVELQEAWEMPDQDIQYLIATGRLKLSIVVYSQTLVTVPPGPHLPTDSKRRVYSGMLDLNPSDAVTILRKGEAPIACFSMPDGQSGHFPYYFRDQTVSKVDELMVRHAERERVERQWLASRASDGPGIFGHSADYRSVHMRDAKFTLGPKQAGVIEQLHRAHMLGQPWCSGRDLLDHVGSEGDRLRDLFKSKSTWSSLILSDGRGLYRLAIPTQQ